MKSDTQARDAAAEKNSRDDDEITHLLETSCYYAALKKSFRDGWDAKAERDRERIKKLEDALRAISEGTGKTSWEDQLIAKAAMDAQGEAKCGLCVDDKPCNFENCPNQQALDERGEGERR